MFRRFNLPSWFFCLIGMVFAVFSPLLTWGQAGSGRFQEADRLFRERKYQSVLDYLQQGRNLFRQVDPETAFLSAASLFQLNRLEEAEKQFVSLLPLKGDFQAEILLFLGQIRFHRQDFTGASMYFKDYLKAIPIGHPRRAEVIHQIRHGAVGLSLQYREPLAKVAELVAPINTQGDEFGASFPIKQPNKICFSHAIADVSIAKPQTDLFCSSLEAGVWQKPRNYSPVLNSPRHEVLLGFNAAGRVMYYFRGENLQKGMLCADSLRRTGKFRINPVNVPLDPISALAPPQIFADSIVFIASRDLGGLGGYDLFRISRHHGIWGKPENLGAEINSPYDENFPFMAADGKTLYFSSNDPDRSIGGFDIFRFVMGIPGLPENLGFPVNSTADDTHFNVAGDGYTACFTSARKSGSGARDLYMAYFYTPLLNQDALQIPSGLALKGNREGGDITFNGLVLSGTEHPLEGDYLNTFEDLRTLLRGYPNLGLTVVTYPHVRLDFQEGVLQALALLQDIRRFFEKAGETNRIILRAHVAPDFNLGNHGLSFRFSGEMPSRLNLSTPSLFEKEEASLLPEGPCYKWLLGEIPMESLTGVAIAGFQGEPNLMLELDGNQIRVYGGQFASREQADWENIRKLPVVPFQEGKVVTREE